MVAYVARRVVRNSSQARRAARLSRLGPDRFRPRIAGEGQPVERSPRDRREIQGHRQLELVGEPRSVEGGEHLIRTAIRLHDLARSGSVRRAGCYQRHRAEGLRDALVAITAIGGEVGSDVNCPRLHLRGHGGNDALRPASADGECSAQSPQLEVQRSQRLQEVPQPWLSGASDEDIVQHEQGGDRSLACGLRERWMV